MRLLTVAAITVLLYASNRIGAKTVFLCEGVARRINFVSAVYKGAE